MSGPEPQYLDEFTSLLVPDDTRVMVDLLKLAVSNRAGEKGRDVLSAVLSGMGTAYPQVSFCFCCFLTGSFLLLACWNTCIGSAGQHPEKLLTHEN